MADVLFYHVVGDIAIGKPKMKEFFISASMRDALKALKLANREEIAVWRMARRHTLREDGGENLEDIQHRFVGILSLMDVVTYLASPEGVKDLEWAMESPVSDIVCPNPGLVQHVTPATSLYQALQIIQKGVRTLLVPMNSTRQKLSTHFSVIYHGRWILPPPAGPKQQLLRRQQDYCCLTVEDVVRFLTGCLSALAPIPLQSLESLGIINEKFESLDLSAQAFEATKFLVKSSLPGRNTAAVALVKDLDTLGDAHSSSRKSRLFGEISSYSFARCDERMISAFASMSAAEFLIFCNYYQTVSLVAESPTLPPEVSESATESLKLFDSSTGEQKFDSTLMSNRVPFLDVLGLSSLPSTTGLASDALKIDAVKSCGKESVDFEVAPTERTLGKPLLPQGMESPHVNTEDARRSIIKKCSQSALAPSGRISVCPTSNLITCRPWNSLAAVLAQMLAHRAPHVWVTQGDGVLLGIVTYVEIVAALCDEQGSSTGPSCRSV